MIKTLHEVQAEHAISKAEHAINYAGLWLDRWARHYARQTRYVEGQLGIGDSASFVYRLGILAATRVKLDNTKIELKDAIGDLMVAAYAWRDQAILQAALDKQTGWLTE